MLRVRFAPPPAEFLHIGGTRTFIFNWLYARSHGGQMEPRKAEMREIPRDESERRRAAGRDAYHVFTAIGREKSIERLRNN